MPILNDNSCHWLSVCCDECRAYYLSQGSDRDECLHELSVLGWLVSDERTLCWACRDASETPVPERNLNADVARPSARAQDEDCLRWRRPSGSDQAKFLTPAQKAHTLAAWKKKLADLPADFPAEGLPGMGWPDPPMAYWCDLINMLPGVVTDQSCTGHRFAADHLTDGELWLLLDRRAASRWERWAPRLALYSWITSVGRRYSEYGPDVFTVTFLGLGHGKAALESSMTLILEFLADLTKRPWWWRRR